MKRLKKPHMEPQEIHCLCKTFLREEKEKKKKKKINTVISLFADSLPYKAACRAVSQPRYLGKIYKKTGFFF